MRTEQTRYVSIRPAHPDRTPSANGGNSSSEPGTTDASRKRKRIGVQVACDTCRIKKTRCDGRRPTCSYCHQRGLSSCTYSDQLGPNGDVNEVLNVLKSAPMHAAINFLRLLRQGHYPSVALGYLQRDVDDGRPPAAQSVFEHELMAQNPVLYPILCPHSVCDLEESNLVHPQLPHDAHAQTYAINCEPRSSKGRVLQTHHVGTESATNLFRVPTATVHPLKKAVLFDARLKSLNISLWSNVPIASDVAARIISLYLETDHPLLGAFDPDSFVSDLVSHRTKFCSALVVNALLYWGCQMYTAIDADTNEYIPKFCAEAKRLWAVEKGRDSPLNMIGAQLLSLASMGHGKDHEFEFLAPAVQMGERLGVFDTKDLTVYGSIDTLSCEQQRSMAFASWGIFNYAMWISCFHSRRNSPCPSFPPSLHIPERGGVARFTGQNGPAGNEVMNDTTRRTTPYMGTTFPAVCEFWRIVHGVPTIGHNVSGRYGEWSNFQEAEMKYREIMAWAEGLPRQFLRTEESPHHVVVLHMWLHAIVLDIFRPFLEQPRLARLRTFSTPGSTAKTAYQASVNQLKHLVVHFRSNYAAAACTMLWQPVLIYVANAMIQEARETPQCRLYFLVCFYGIQALRKAFRVCEIIGRGLVTMMLRNDNMSNTGAREAIEHLRQSGYDDAPGKIRANLIGDLELAQSNPDAANMEQLAAGFDDLAAFYEFIDY